MSARPRWQTTVNPVTGKLYASEEEYLRVPKFKDQICKNDYLDKLEDEKDSLAAEIPTIADNPRKREKEPCSKLRKRLKALNEVLAKRRQIQNECFGGNVDDRHKRPISQLEQAIKNTTSLEKVNCAPGHPMAEL